MIKTMKVDGDNDHNGNNEIYITNVNLMVLRICNDHCFVFWNVFWGFFSNAIDSNAVIITDIIIIIVSSATLVAI